jgi:type I restriction enzyme S subunit
MYWVLLSRPFSVFCDLSSLGSTIQHLYQNVFERFAFPVPSLEEQQTIAAFLDRETAKIDALIAEQQRLVELLAEKRQAVISHAVTKGLNSNARMKDSGIEWLGEVPENWSVVPLKRILEAKDGTHATPPYVDPADDTFPLITSKDFGVTEICFDEAKYISVEDHLEVMKRSNTQRGDVLMSMIGGNIGKALIVETNREFSIKNVALFKTHHSEFLAKYLLYYLQSGLLDIQIDLLSRGGAQGFLGLGGIRNLVFFKIPPAELLLLVQNLESRLAPFTELVKAAEESLLLMQERRSALISDAVTGKIDVRKAA